MAIVTISLAVLTLNRAMDQRHAWKVAVMRNSNRYDDEAGRQFTIGGEPELPCVVRDQHGMLWVIPKDRMGENPRYDPPPMRSRYDPPPMRPVDLYTMGRRDLGTWCD